MKSVTSKNKGFTLVELVVVVGIMGIVMSVAFTFLLSNYKTFFRANETIDTQYEAQMGMNGIVDKVVESQKIYNYLDTANELAVIFKINDNKYIKYIYDKNAETLSRGEDTDSNVDDISQYAKNIENVQVEFLPTGASQINAQGIKITITCEGIELTNDVYFRNWK